MPVQAKTTKKTAFVFFPFSERAVRFAYSGLIVLLMLGITLFQGWENHRFKLRQAEGMKQAETLIEAGFYAEAQDILKKLPRPLPEKVQQMLFQVSLKKHDFVYASAMLKTEPFPHKKENALLLLSTLAEADRSQQAWKVLATELSDADANSRKQWAITLLEDVRETPIADQFQSGWYHDAFAILKDEEGCYLTDAEGEAIDAERYEEILPVESGFVARRRNLWVRLDSNGRFAGTATAPAKEKTLSPDAKYPLQPYQEGNLWGYAYHGEPVTKALYEKASSVSSHGTAYALSEGKTYRIRFRALREGISFNRIEP